jgi:hypothetical protein
VIILVGLLWRDHFRSSAVILELTVVAASLVLFLDPVRRLDWSYLVMSVTITAIILAALCTSLLIWRNTDSKIDLLVIKAGRTRCFLAMLLGAYTITLFWLAVVAVYIYLFLPLEIILPGLPVLLLATACILLVVPALFMLLSALPGSSFESYIAVILIVFGLSSSYFIYLGGWWRFIAGLLPPLQETIYAASGNHAIPLAKSALYAAAVAALGLARFSRRQFTRL